MKAVVFDGHLRLVADRPEPAPAPGEARIRTILVGICSTDLEVVRGYAGFRGVPGHEFVGVVDLAEDPSWIGQRVVGEINVGCGVCDTCRAGQPGHCPSRTALGIRGRDGVLAELFCLPVANLHPVPVEVPDRAAVFVEPLAAACQLLEQIHVRPSDRVVVLGDGRLGLMASQVLALTGCELTVVGRHEEKLAILARRGIDARLSDEGLGGADLVVECTGRPSGFETAQRLVRPRGTLALKSTYHGLAEIDLSRLVVDEIRVVGSRCGPFKAALRLLACGLVDVMSQIHAEMRLDEALAAYELAAQPGVLKVLVRVAD
ncbi:MAG: alcohol dehydrogenase catalytic domain-containing protein [Anaerolineae bacterium]|nr:alcohol dehydrogenase catalytic domain-containing protein [Anaerolineae bacterium]